MDDRDEPAGRRQPADGSPARAPLSLAAAARPGAGGVGLGTGARGRRGWAWRLGRLAPLWGSLGLGCAPKPAPTGEGCPSEPCGVASDPAVEAVDSQPGLAPSETGAGPSGDEGARGAEPVDAEPGVPEVLDGPSGPLEIRARAVGPRKTSAVALASGEVVVFDGFSMAVFQPDGAVTTDLSLIAGLEDEFFIDDEESYQYGMPVELVALSGHPAAGGVVAQFVQEFERSGSQAWIMRRDPPASGADAPGRWRKLGHAERQLEWRYASIVPVGSRYVAGIERWSIRDPEVMWDEHDGSPAAERKYKALMRRLDAKPKARVIWLDPAAPGPGDPAGDDRPGVPDFDRVIRGLELPDPDAKWSVFAIASDGRRWAMTAGAHWSATTLWVGTASEGLVPLELGELERGRELSVCSVAGEPDGGFSGLAILGAPKGQDHAESQPLGLWWDLTFGGDAPRWELVELPNSPLSCDFVRAARTADGARWVLLDGLGDDWPGHWELWRRPAAAREWERIELPRQRIPAEAARVVRSGRTWIEADPAARAKRVVVRPHWIQPLGERLLVGAYADEDPGDGSWPGIAWVLEVGAQPTTADLVTFPREWELAARLTERRAPVRFGSARAKQVPALCRYVFAPIEPGQGETVGSDELVARTYAAVAEAELVDGQVVRGRWRGRERLGVAGPSWDEGEPWSRFVAAAAAHGLALPELYCGTPFVTAIVDPPSPG